MPLPRVCGSRVHLRPLTVDQLLAESSSDDEQIVAEAGQQEGRSWRWEASKGQTETKAGESGAARSN